MWLQVGFITGLFLIFLYVIFLIFNKKFRIFLSEVVLEDTIYGNIVGDKLEQEEKTVGNLIVGYFTVISFTLLVGLVVLLLLTLLGYISVLLIIMLVVAFILAIKNAHS